MEHRDKIKQLESKVEALEQENTVLKTIIDEIPGSIYWKDTTGKYLGRNKFAHEMMLAVGLEADTKVDSVIGKTDYDYFVKEVADGYHANDMEVLKTCEPNIKEETVLLSSGKEVTQLSLKKPLFNKKGDVIGLIGNTIDISAQKKAEQLVIEKEEEERKSKFFSLVAGEIAHDLRTPLAVIQSLLNAIEQVHPKLLSGYQAALDNNLSIKKIRPHKLQSLSTVIPKAKEQIIFINHFIDMMLNNLKQDDITTENYQEFYIAQLIHDSILIYPFQDDESSLLNLNLEFDFKIWCEPLYFQNILNNLIKNSLYFIKEQQKGKISIYSEITENYNILHYSDTAKGASQEICEHLFDGYYSKRKEGTGLGMVFCKSVMESLGGQITVESVEGDYIHFILKFPKR